MATVLTQKYCCIRCVQPAYRTWFVSGALNLNQNNQLVFTSMGEIWQDMLQLITYYKKYIQYNILYAYLSPNLIPEGPMAYIHTITLYSICSWNLILRETVPLSTYWSDELKNTYGCICRSQFYIWNTNSTVCNLMTTLLEKTGKNDKFNEYLLMGWSESHILLTF